MKRHPRNYAAATGLLLAVAAMPPAFAQKQGDILRQYIIDSPASMSIHEETTVVAERPMMAVMNNLVVFDQHVKQNSLLTLAGTATDWARDEDGTDCSSICARASSARRQAVHRR
jgi:peptide/nickel transport system substrate-binding protein